MNSVFDMKLVENRVHFFVQVILRVPIDFQDLIRWENAAISTYHQDRNQAIGDCLYTAKQEVSPGNHPEEAEFSQDCQRNENLCYIRYHKGDNLCRYDACFSFISNDEGSEAISR